MKLEHIALNVAEPEAVAAWYQAHLGLRLAQVSPTPTFTAYFLADDQATVLEFYRNPAVSVPDYAAMPPAHLHVAFVTDDADREVARLTTAGATQVGEKVIFPSGVMFYYVRDPWGLPLQIVQRPQPLL